MGVGEGLIAAWGEGDAATVVVAASSELAELMASVASDETARDVGVPTSVSMHPEKVEINRAAVSSAVSLA